VIALGRYRGPGSVRPIISARQFVDWDHRPAVLVGDKAFAVLAPEEPWVSVDRDDVFHTAVALSEPAWRS
jgi:hypothetical protein